ncbi:hypothetical protein Glove_297g14 [Diversispora epigaea]|uniref:Uncharacterized protein n=1 Tax=Diversispora epigaea TaxID=1348612 RepID=A0A397HXX9_9GLOM|nr:hypothetical protein Glove_297g14 [Diversispora epigaea]
MEIMEDIKRKLKMLDTRLIEGKELVAELVVELEASKKELDQNEENFEIITIDYSNGSEIS